MLIANKITSYTNVSFSVGVARRRHRWFLIRPHKIALLPLPLSFAQQRLWFLAQLEPDSPFYNIPAAVRLKGELNLNALQQTFNEILRRHEALRTNFQTIEGQAIAVISQAKPLRLPTIDISELPLTQQEGEIRQQAAQEAQQPFDISSNYLLRVKLLRLDAQDTLYY